jgi:hypothetical protein
MVLVFATDPAACYRDFELAKPNEAFWKLQIQTAIDDDDVVLEECADPVDIPSTIKEALVPCACG